MIKIMLLGDSCLEISTITSKQEMKLIYKDDVPFYEDKGQLNSKHPTKCIL